MSATTSPNLDDLLRVLNAATDKNALQWNKTAEEDTFRTELGGIGMVRLAKVSDASRYSLSVIDHEGTLLDEFRPSGEGELIPMETLYKKVRRNSLNLEWKLRSVYDQLRTLAGES